MEKIEHSQFFETKQERALREMFQEQALGEVEVDQAWMAVASRLPLLKDNVVPISQEKVLPLRPNQRRSTFWLKRSMLLVACLCLAVLLMGAGYNAGIQVGTAHHPLGSQAGVGNSSKLQVYSLVSSIGDIESYKKDYAFEHVGQTQQQNGISISLTDVHMGTAATIAGLDIAITKEIASKWNNVVLSQYTLANGQEKQPKFLQTQRCTPLSAEKTVAHCIIASTNQTLKNVNGQWVYEINKIPTDTKSPQNWSLRIAKLMFNNLPSVGKEEADGSHPYVMVFSNNAPEQLEKDNPNIQFVSGQWNFTFQTNFYQDNPRSLINNSIIVVAEPSEGK